MQQPSEDIIDKVLAGLATQEDAKNVAEWFATTEGQNYLDERMDRDFILFKAGDENRILDHEVPSERIYEVVSKKIRIKKMKRLVFAVAAVLIPFILITALFFEVDSKVDIFGKTVYDEIYVPKGERAQFIFQDGTRAYINSDSKIRYPRQFGLSDRTIYMQGEVYFEVESNPKRPFIVELDNGYVQVLGTSFNVDAYSDKNEIRITLDEGTVNLRPSSSDQKYTINQGQAIVYNKESQECKILNMADTQRASLWKKDVICFTNTPLSEVVEKLGRWYNIEFRIEDQDALKYAYTITTKGVALENVLRDLEKIAPVRFDIEGGCVKVSVDNIFNIN